MFRIFFWVSTLSLFCFTALAQPLDEPASQPVDTATSQPASRPTPADEPSTRADQGSGPSSADDEDIAPVETCAAAPATGEPALADGMADQDGPATWSTDLDTRVRLLQRGAFTLHMGGLIQVQGAFFVGEDAALQFEDPANSEGFRIRRARLGFGGQLLPDVAYYLAIDLKDVVDAALGGDQGNEMLDATITWNRFDVVRIAAGVDRVPFSIFALQSSASLTIIERPLMVRLMDPDRRVGVRVFGQLGSLDYATGVFNGSEGVTSGNRLAGLAAAVRLNYHLLGRRTGFVPRELGIQLGGAYVHDDGPVVNSDRVAVSLQVEGFRARLTGELLWQRSVPHEVPAGEPDAGVVTRWGAAGELGVFVWREHVELAARYEYFRDNVRLIEFGRQQLISAGLNVYLCQDRFKLQANYMRRDERGGPELDNDIALAQLQASF